MSTLARYRVLRLLTWVSIPVVLWIIGKITLAGMGGNSVTARRWFYVLAIFMIIDLPLVVAFYYHRNAVKQTNLEKIGVETLATLARQPTDKYPK